MIGDVLSRFLALLPPPDRAWVKAQPGEHQQRMAGQWAISGCGDFRADAFSSGLVRTPEHAALDVVALYRLTP